MKIIVCLFFLHLFVFTVYAGGGLNCACNDLEVCTCNCGAVDCNCDCTCPDPEECPECPEPEECPAPQPESDFEPIPMTKTGKRICLPSKRQSLGINSFRTKVEGKTYSNIYTIIESTEPTSSLYRSRFRFHLSGIGEMTLDKIYRKNSTNCVEEIGEDFGTLAFNGKRAVVDGERINTAGETIPVHTFFISRSPENHLILLICDTANIMSHGNRRFCKGDYRVDILVSMDPPNRVNWLKIEKTMRKALGVRLTDSRTYFLFIGEECAFETM